MSADDRIAELEKALLLAQSEFAMQGITRERYKGDEHVIGVLDAIDSALKPQEITK